MTDKTEKELAFLHDLYVATDWGERFAELVDEHVKLPKKGRALYVAAGTGEHALALKMRAGKDVSLVCVDEGRERLEIARAKAAAMVGAGETVFRQEQLETLSFDDEQFELVIGDASLVAPERLPEIFAEMARVAAPGGTLALNVATASSFGEFFSVYWEALDAAGFDEQAADVTSLINSLPTVSDVETLTARAGVDDVRSWTRIEEFDYATGEAFLNDPFVRNFLLVAWLEHLPDEDAREKVLAEVARIIDADRHELDFSLSIKATLVTGRKAE